MAGSDQQSTASRVADRLRTRIIEGKVQPGERLSEERVRQAMGVSRSTLREAFQLLIRERLLVHTLSRGVFVRRLSADDISDLYRVRRVIECATLRELEVLPPAGLRTLVASAEDGRTAARSRRWQEVAAASIRFHKALVALAGSERLDGLITQVLAEFRLAYAMMNDPYAFHAYFLAKHAPITDAVRSGELDRAADLLDAYLREAEDRLISAYAAHT
ncbi:MAG: GntR family transcriptional regulator [Streptosporangiales bacterium]